jgi:hypothetical protein
MSPPCASITAVSYTGNVYTGNLVCLVLGLLVPVLCLAVFLYYKNYSIVMRRRSTTLVLISMTGCLIVVCHTLLRDVLGPSTFSCILYFSLVYTTIPMITTPLLLRLKLYQNAQLAAKKRMDHATHSAKNKAPDENLRHSQQFSDTSSIGKSSESRFTSSGAICVAMIAYLRVVLFGFRRSNSPSSSSETELNQLAFHFSQTSSFVWLWMALSVLPGFVAWLVRIAATPENRANCAGCEMGLGDAIFLASNVAFIVLLSLSMSIPLYKSKRDPLRLLDELIVTAVIGGLPAFIGIVMHVIDPGGMHLVLHGIDWLSIACLGAVNLVFGQTVFVLMLAKRSRFSALISNDLGVRERFQAVMNDKSLKTLFRDHLIAELGDESLLFMDAVDSFIADPKNAKKRAADIVATYMVRNAPLEVNISSATRTAALNKFTSGNGVVDLEVFADSRREIQDMLMADSFPRFLARLGHVKSAHVTDNHGVEVQSMDSSRRDFVVVSPAAGAV